MAYGPTVDDRLVAYGPEVTLDVAYGLTSRESAVKAVAYGLRWSSAVPYGSYMQRLAVYRPEVRRRTTSEST